MHVRNIEINSAVFKKKREDQRLSTREVEQLTGITRSTVSNAETGRHLPDGKTLLKLMFFYGLSKEEIIVQQ